jgi:hypothetical protein
MWLDKIFSLIFPILCQYIFQYNFDFIRYLLIKSWKMRQNSGRNSWQKYFYNIIPIFALDKIFSFILSQFSCDWRKYFYNIIPIFALDKIFSLLLSQFSCDWIKYFPLYLPYYVNIYLNIFLISSNIYW